MKKFMYMCMMLLAATLTFTACGSDDDDNGNNGGNNGGNNNQQQGPIEVVQDNYYKYQDSFNLHYKNGQGITPCPFVVILHSYMTLILPIQFLDQY